jgi:hypothetical protein
VSLRRETRLGVGLLLGLQLLTASAAIALLGRTSPAIEAILRENVRSEEAVEAMLGALLATDAAAPERFDAALRDARANVTEAEEPALLDRIAKAADGALAGDPRARAEATAALMALGAVNRDAMRRADLDAQRLGQAGAWASALLGLIGFGAGLVVYRRLRARLERPIVEIDAALRAVRAGDTHRRCLPLEGPAETRRIATHLNQLFDQLATPSPAGPAGLAPERGALLYLLDAIDLPALVVDGEGAVIADNAAAHDLFAHAVPGTRARLVAALTAGGSEPGWHAEDLGDAGWLLRRVQPSPGRVIEA